MASLTVNKFVPGVRVRDTKSGRVGEFLSEETDGIRCHVAFEDRIVRLNLDRLELVPEPQPEPQEPVKLYGTVIRSIYGEIRLEPFWLHKTNERFSDVTFVIYTAIARAALLTASSQKELTARREQLEKTAEEQLGDRKYFNWVWQHLPVCEREKITRLAYADRKLVGCAA